MDEKDFSSIVTAIISAIDCLFNEEKVIVETDNIELNNLCNSIDFDRIAKKLNVPLDTKINGIFGIRFRNCLFRISRSILSSNDKKTNVYYTIELVLDIIL
jgi:hypothetical protein